MCYLSLYADVFYKYGTGLLPHPSGPNYESDGNPHGYGVLQRNRQPDSSLFTAICLGPARGSGKGGTTNGLTKSVLVSGFEEALQLLAGFKGTVAMLSADEREGIIARFTKGRWTSDGDD